MHEAAKDGWAKTVTWFESLCGGRRESLLSSPKERGDKTCADKERCT